jgi:hypothetical protein
VKLFERVSDPWGRAAAPLGEGARARVLKHMIGQDAWGRYGLKEVSADKGVKTGADAAPTLEATHGFTGVGDVLAYRRMWDDYVLGVVQANYMAAASLRAESQGLPSFSYTLRGASSPTTIPIYVRPSTSTQDPQILSTVADSDDSSGNYLLSRWNLDAGKKDWEIVYFAGSILQEQQRTVQIAGTRAAELRARFPSLPLPSPPEKSIQRDVIAHLEAGQYIASGVLQMFTGAAGAELKSAGAVVDELGKGGKKLIDLMDWVPYLAVGGGVAVMFLVIWLGTRVKSIGAAGVALKDPEPRVETVTVPIQPAAEYDTTEDALVIDPAREPPPEVADELELIDDEA